MLDGGGAIQIMTGPSSSVMDTCSTLLLTYADENKKNFCADDHTDDVRIVVNLSSPRLVDHKSDFMASHELAICPENADGSHVLSNRMCVHCFRCVHW